MRVDRHDDTEAHKQSHCRRTAVTHERQRHTDDWQQPGDHRDVNKYVYEERQRQPADREAPERLSGLRCDIEAARDDDEVQHQQCDDADQSQFLGDDRDDEVGLAFWQELEMRLGPSNSPLPNTPPEPIAVVD